MPLVGDKTHHCAKCQKSTSEKSRGGGACGKHQEVCPEHKHWFYYKGESCIKCDEAEGRDVTAARADKEQQKKIEQQAEEDAFFKDTKKDRKPRKKSQEGGQSA